LRGSRTLMWPNASSTPSRASVPVRGDQIVDEIASSAGSMIAAVRAAEPL